MLGHEVDGELDDGTRVTVAHRVPCGVLRALPRRPRVDVCRVRAPCGSHPGGFAERLRATHVVPLPAAFGELDGVWVEPLACVLRAAELVSRAAVCSSSAAARSGCSGCRCSVGVATRSSPPTRGPSGSRSRAELGAVDDDGPVGAAVRHRRGRRRTTRSPGSSPAARCSSSPRPRRRPASRSMRSTGRSCTSSARARRLPALFRRGDRAPAVA